MKRIGISLFFSFMLILFGFNCNSGGKSPASAEVKKDSLSQSQKFVSSGENVQKLFDNYIFINSSPYLLRFNISSHKLDTLLELEGMKYAQASNGKIYIYQQKDSELYFYSYSGNNLKSLYGLPISDLKEKIKQFVGKDSIEIDQIDAIKLSGSFAVLHFVYYMTNDVDQIPEEITLDLDFSTGDLSKYTYPKTTKKQIIYARDGQKLILPDSNYLVSAGDKIKFYDNKVNSAKILFSYDGYIEEDEYIKPLLFAGPQYSAFLWVIPTGHVENDLGYMDYLYTGILFNVQGDSLHVQIYKEFVWIGDAEIFTDKGGFYDLKDKEHIPVGESLQFFLTDTAKKVVDITEF